MQEQGRKIQEVLKRKGLKQYLFVQDLGWNPTSFSRKVKEGEDFSTLKLQAIADALGVKREFLENKEIEYHRSKPIPPDAIAEKKPPDMALTDPVKALLELAEMNMAHRKAVDSQIPPEIMAQAAAELISELSGLTKEVRLLREEMARAREENRGEHDPD